MGARRSQAEVPTDRFERAGIGCGRIGHGIEDGRVQGWEIDPSPTLLLPKHFDDPVRRPLHVAFRERPGQALADLGRS
jgi:hypothetical protein